MVHKTKFARVRSTMTTFVKVQVPFVISTISTHHRDDEREGVEKTCVCSHNTWNSTSLTMEVKEF
jgi:hypothetical protein